MRIVERKLEELQPYERNAKKHDERQIENVANSLRRFGWRQPIVIDGDDVIVIGHCRALAAKRLGMEMVPVVVADDLTADEIRELRIADNKTNESPWDFDMLDMDIDGLRFEGFDFDLGGAVDFEPFDGEGDGGGSQIANGTKVRCVLGALLFDIDDPAHEIYKRTKEADAEKQKAILADLIARGVLL